MQTRSQRLLQALVLRVPGAPVTVYILPVHETRDVLRMVLGFHTSGTVHADATYGTSNRAAAMMDKVVRFMDVAV